MIEKGLEDVSMGAADTLVALAKQHALRRPEHSFVLFRSQKGIVDNFTYGALWQRANEICHNLLVGGVSPGDLVVIVHEPTRDLYASFVATMMLGARPSLMPYPNPKQADKVYWSTHRDLFDRIRPARILLSPRLFGMYSESLPELAHITEALICQDASGRGTTEITRKLSPSDVAFLQHSSGTTANKKGVMLTHAAVISHVLAYASVTGCSEDSVVASWLPLYHDMGLIACFMMPLALGATVVAIDPFEWVTRPSLLFEAITDHKATLCWMPNFGFAHSVNAVKSPERYDLSSLVALVNCSEPCRDHTQASFLNHFSASRLRPETLKVCYAMAENVFAISQTPFHEPVRVLDVSRSGLAGGRIHPPLASDDAQRLCSCGRLLNGVEVRIVGSDGNDVPLGQVGEVALRTTTMFSGYNCRPDLTERAFRDTWYLTRDLGFLDSGELFIIGRTDDLIIAFGKNLMAHELEAIVNQVDGVKPGRAVVFAVESERTGTSDIIVLVEVLAEYDPDVVTRAIRVRLGSEGGLIPQHVEAVPPGSLLKTTSGKVGRASNRSAYLSRQRALDH